MIATASPLRAASETPFSTGVAPKLLAMLRASIAIMPLNFATSNVPYAPVCFRRRPGILALTQSQRYPIVSF